MELIICSDIHEHYSETIEKIKSLKGDAILIAGDITNRGNYDLEFFTQLGNIAPVYFVTGNHDINMHDLQLELNTTYPIINVTDKEANLGSYTILGMNLSPCYSIPKLATVWDRMTSNEQVEEAYYAQFKKADIILSHCPPTGVTADEGYGDIGSKYLRKYIEMNQPKLVICGHVHKPKQNEEIIENTKVINTATKVWKITLEN